MPSARFRAGELYPSKSVVRAHYREYWKGILVRGEELAIIQAHRGFARRVHYPDQLDPVSMTLRYVGEGLNGDQELTRTNKALVEAARTGQAVQVFLDCGDIRLPAGRDRRIEKHFLAAGQWRIVRAAYEKLRSEGRRVWRFTLVPVSEDTRRVLQSIFLESAGGFERTLKRFAAARAELYRDFDHILRARDSIAGHVGEYFAVKRFNAAHPARPLVRVRSNFRDLDAIQTVSGSRFAVKTITGQVQKTSNIWTPLDDLPRFLDAFLVLELDPFLLTPKALFRLPVRKAKAFWAIDSYQGAGKLLVDARFRDAAEQL